MKFTNAATYVALISASSVFAVPVKRDVNPALVPQFGVKAGVNPTGTGDCDGINGIKIPCTCPPDRNAFIKSLNANVKAGKVVNNTGLSVSFPTGNSKADQFDRIQAAIDTLQNLNGPGKGCPVASTTFAAQQAAILALPASSSSSRATHSSSSSSRATHSSSSSSRATHSSSSSSRATSSSPRATHSSSSSRATHSSSSSSRAAPSSSSSSRAASSSAPSGTALPDIAALAPKLGGTAGKNPDGTGNCDGAVNGADGKPVKVPCSCPPSQNAYIAALTANVKAGKAVNNPSLKVTFPTSNSKADQLARVTAAVITLQNLNGPGKGCPVASTTLLAQQQALTA